MKAKILCGDVANLGLLHAEIGALGEVAYAQRADAQLAEVDLQESDILVGHAGEDCIEQRAERGNGEDEWQSHTEKSTDTHCCLSWFVYLFCLSVGYPVRQRERLWCRNEGFGRS